MSLVSCLREGCPYKNSAGICTKDIILLNEIGACNLYTKIRNGQIMFTNPRPEDLEDHKVHWYMELEESDAEEKE